jgi:xanthine dehydrogenase/oxidase
VAWYRPTSLASLLDLKARFPESRLVAGNTEVGIETKFKHVPVPVIVSPTAVPELGAIRVTEKVGGSNDQMVVGGVASLVCD